MYITTLSMSVSWGLKQLPHTQRILQDEVEEFEFTRDNTRGKE